MNDTVSTRLKLPTWPPTAVFRAIVHRLKADPVLQRVIPPGSWLTWDGDPRANHPLPKTSPAIRLTPTTGANAWWSPQAQVGPLLIAVELSVSTSCVDDVMNLWGAIVRAIYTGDVPGEAAFSVVLQGLGAHTGMITFSLPAFDHSPEADGAGMFVATGQMKLDIRINT
jgi:hypothetical protein